MIFMQNPTGIFKDPMKPTRVELKVWAYGDYSLPIQNFQLFAMSDPYQALDFAVDTRCAKRDFFLESLYVWTGDQVRSGMPERESFEKWLSIAEESHDERIQKLTERVRALILDPYSYDSDKWGLGGSYAREQL